MTVTASRMTNDAFVSKPVAVLARVKVATFVVVLPGPADTATVAVWNLENVFSTA